MSEVILFAFWGRQPNVEVQLPFIRRILDGHPNVRFHGWNLARTAQDCAYLRTIEGERVQIINRFYGPRSWQRMPRVWSYYLQPRFRQSLFVKIDDDLVFLETERFGEFVRAIERDKHNTVFSAEVINNGACTRLQPQLWEGFEQLDIDLLDVHLHNAYAQMAHGWFFDNWQDAINRPVARVPTQDWLSINCIGFNWETLARMVKRIGHMSPHEIAGRRWPPHARVGDEGAANLQPRMIVRGFTTAHLGFGPQKITDEQQTLWLKKYREIGERYLQ